MVDVVGDGLEHIFQHLDLREQEQDVDGVVVRREEQTQDADEVVDDTRDYPLYHDDPLRGLELV